MLFRTLVLFLVFLIFFIPQKKADELSVIKFIEFLYQSNDYYRVISEANKLLFHYPKNSAANYIRSLKAKSFYKLGEYEESLNELDSIDQLELNSLVLGEYHSVKGFSLLKLGWEKSSFTELNKSLSQQEMADFPFQKNLSFTDQEEAVRWNSVIPGTGFLFTNEYEKACVSFLLNVLFVYGTYANFVDQNYGIASLLLFFEIGWYEGGNHAVIESVERINSMKLRDYRSSWIEQREQGW